MNRNMTWIIFLGMIVASCSQVSHKSDSQGALSSLTTNEHNDSECKVNAALLGNGVISEGLINEFLRVANCYQLSGIFSKSYYYYSLSQENAKNTDQKYTAIIGKAFLKTQYGHDQEAQLLFSQAQQIKNSFEVSYGLAQLYLKYGAYDKAVAQMQPFLSNANGETYEVLAVANLLQGNVDSALQSFQRLPASYTQSPRAGIHYAWALTLNKQFDQARKVLEKTKGTNDESLTHLKEYIFSKIKEGSNNEGS